MNEECSDGADGSNNEQLEYDLSQLKGGVRGKYYERYQAGTNLALLEPDIRRSFPTDEAVNTALRRLMQSHSV
jgi:hypothetical protein